MQMTRAVLSFSESPVHAVTHLCQELSWLCGVGSSNQKSKLTLCVLLLVAYYALSCSWQIESQVIWVFSCALFMLLNIFMLMVCRVRISPENCSFYYVFLTQSLLFSVLNTEGIFYFYNLSFLHKDVFTSKSRICVKTYGRNMEDLEYWQPVMLPFLQIHIE